ncbi:hypothetical protein [Aquimarina agarilytica]|uniref:hypothetical protein n=1 Tax=Aquimarina agarilytica TaxID=1087449 RepID=UPI0003109367|nr:hypothetical protein [Aquimarina agarilytica]
MSQKRNLKSWIHNLVDEDGIKTEVTLEMDDEMLRKLVFAILGAGTGVILFHHLLKNTIPNRQLSSIQNQLQQLKIANT